MNRPSLKSTLPRLRCFIVLMIDEPMIRVRPVPTAIGAGTPKTNRPPVIRKPPPTPKKPLRVPRIKPEQQQQGRVENHVGIGEYSMTSPEESLGSFQTGAKAVPVGISLPKTSKEQTPSPPLPPSPARPIPRDFRRRSLAGIRSRIHTWRRPFLGPGQHRGVAELCVAASTA